MGPNTPSRARADSLLPWDTLACLSRGRIMMLLWRAYDLVPDPVPNKKHTASG